MSDKMANNTADSNTLQTPQLATAEQTCSITPQTPNPATRKPAAAMADKQEEKKKKGEKGISCNDDEMLSPARAAASASLDPAIGSQMSEAMFGRKIRAKHTEKSTEDTEPGEKAAASKGENLKDDDDDGEDDPDDDDGDDDHNDKDHDPEEHADDDDDDEDDDDNEQQTSNATDSGRQSANELATPRRSTRKRRPPTTEPEVETATPRRLRPRTSTKPATPTSSARRSSPAQSSSTPAPSANAPGSPPTKASSPAKAISFPSETAERDLGPLGERAPRPTMGPDGKRMNIGDVLFVTEEQLSKEKRMKLSSKKVATIENLTFQDIRKYNRDQLRSYCVVYNIPRGKKTEMEAFMARFVCWWNNGEGEFAFNKYEPSHVRSFDPDAPLLQLINRPPGKSRKFEEVKPTPSPSTSDVTGVLAAAQHAATATAEQISLGPAAGFPRRASGRAIPQPVPIQVGAAMNGVLHKPVGGAAPNAITGASAASTPQAVRPRPAAGVASSSRGNATSFKQKVHARQAGAKFKAAYNGAGPAIVNIVENAAAYFEGRDAPEVIRDQAKSYARYQFNVDLLTEIFDGPVVDSEPGEAATKSKAPDGDGDVQMGDGADDGADRVKEGPLSTEQRAELLRDAARNAVREDAARCTATIEELEQRGATLAEDIRQAERVNMRMFQRLERADTSEEVEEVRRVFEAESGMTLETAQPAVCTKRAIDKTKPLIRLDDASSRILRVNL